MAGYIGARASVVSSGAERKQTYAITTTTTSLTGLAYTPTKVHVYHNGIRLVDGTDYTATDGSTITLTNAAQNGDEVVVISYATFQTSDTVSASAGGTFAGNVEHTGTLTASGAFTSLGIDDNATSTAMTLDSSGNLLVGKTDTSINTQGVLFNPNFSHMSSTNDVPLALNRKSSDGAILQFRKDGSTAGSIGNASANSIYIAGNGSAAANLGFGGSSLIYATVDNVADLGAAGLRFDDIYATNGTIQTSDQNEKQQIASLTDAEMTAAKAISKLFKTFKWNDSVAEKGDAARTHSGVIAQEVEQAMTDAGLNAGDYAFFISTTWWEADGETYETAEEAPEGAVERNRKGIRYPQLLSFIGAATEQRLASIESRLDALETA
jgi:hypothetical protein